MVTYFNLTVKFFYSCYILTMIKYKRTINDVKHTDEAYYQEMPAHVGKRRHNQKSALEIQPEENPSYGVNMNVMNSDHEINTTQGCEADYEAISQQ